METSNNENNGNKRLQKIKDIKHKIYRTYNVIGISLDKSVAGVVSVAISECFFYFI